MVVAIAGASLLASCSTPSAVARGPARHEPNVVTTATSTTFTVPPKTTIPPTTTTVPPTTTTTIPMATVPDAAGPGEKAGSRAVADDVLTKAGFIAADDPTSSGACYFDSPISGPNSWNAGEVLGQSPLPGTLAPLGSTVYIQVCAGTPTVNLGQ